MTTREAPPSIRGAGQGRRGRSFLIAAGDMLAFHRVGGCDETWTLVAGGPVEVHLIHPDGRHEMRLLSIDRDASAVSATAIAPGVLRAARLAPGGMPARLRRSGGSERSPACVEFPRAADILRQHPLHRGIVLDLTAA
jgi:predicted cupin superfamily sugar epimerase